MSLETNQLLHDIGVIAAGNSSPSLDPKDILVRGAQKIAAGNAKMAANRKRQCAQWEAAQRRAKAVREQAAAAAKAAAIKAEHAQVARALAVLQTQDEESTDDFDTANEDGSSDGGRELQDDANDLCVVCWDAKKTHCFFCDAGAHLCVCAGCAKGMTACPMCRCDGPPKKLY